MAVSQMFVRVHVALLYNEHAQASPIDKYYRYQIKNCFPFHIKGKQHTPYAIRHTIN